MTNLVYGVKFKNKNVIKNISLLRTSDRIIFTGDAVDGYGGHYELKTKQQELINEAFEYVLVGNKVASVKMEVVKVLWSSMSSNSFILALKAPENSDDVCVMNSFVFLGIGRTGFIVQDDLWEDGYDIREVVGE